MLQDSEMPKKRGLEHVIKSGDTVQGIAIQYGMKPQDLKRANKLWNDNIHIRKTLAIPLEYCTVSEAVLRAMQEKAQAELEVCGFHNGLLDPSQ